MKIFSSLSELSSISDQISPISSSSSFSSSPSQKDHPKPLVLTLGMFDGVHLGHQQILKKLQEKKDGGKSCVITFKNHPLSVLYPQKFFPCLYDYQTKLALLEKFSIDYVIGLTFSHNLAEQSFSSFLEEVRQFYPFTHLILGEDAVFGKNMNGTKQEVSAFAKKKGFSVKYIPLLEYEGKKISSSWIKELIKKKDMKKAERLLGESFLPKELKI